MRDNPTIILSDEGEPQPDAALLIEADRGGACRVDESGYLQGPPELVVEVAVSSQSFDLYEKRRDYERAGVRKYVVVGLRDRAMHWFVLQDAAFQERTLDADQVLRSAVFPGLWLDTAALLRLDPRGVKDALEQGLATPEHAAFVQQLEQQAKRTR